MGRIFSGLTYSWYTSLLSWSLPVPGSKKVEAVADQGEDQSVDWSMLHGQLSAVSQLETWLEAGWPMRGAATRSHHLWQDLSSVVTGCEAVRACNIFVSPWWCSVFWSLLIFRSLVDIADRHNVLSDQGPREGLHQFHPRPLHRLSDAPLLPDPLVSPDGSRCQALRPFHFNWS